MLFFQHFSIFIPILLRVFFFSVPSDLSGLTQPDRVSSVPFGASAEAFPIVILVEHQSTIHNTHAPILYYIFERLLYAPRVFTVRSISGMLFIHMQPTEPVRL